MMGFKKRYISAVAILFVLTGCSSTTSPTATNGNEPVELVNDGSGKSEDTYRGGTVCTYEKVAGKLIKQKTCYTKQQRLEIRDASQEKARDIKRSRPSNPALPM